MILYTIKALFIGHFWLLTYCLALGFIMRVFPLPLLLNAKFMLKKYLLKKVIKSNSTVEPAINHWKQSHRLFKAIVVLLLLLSLSGFGYSLFKIMTQRFFFPQLYFAVYYLTALLFPLITGGLFWVYLKASKNKITTNEANSL